MKKYRVLSFDELKEKPDVKERGGRGRLKCFGDERDVYLKGSMEDDVAGKEFEIEDEREFPIEIKYWNIYRWMCEEI